MGSANTKGREGERNGKISNSDFFFFLIISRSLAAICLFPIFPSRSSFLRSAAVLSAVLLLCNNTNAPFIAVAALVYFALSDTVVGSL